MVCRPATLWDWQKCRVMGHTMTYWNGLSGNGAQRSYQVLQVTLLPLQCESQIRERSKRPRVLTSVCSQIRSGVPVSHGSTSTGSCWLLLLTTAHSLQGCRHTADTLPSSDVCLLLTALLSSPVPPSSTIWALHILQLSLKTFFRLILTLQMLQN